jgi:transcriptional regulatory protein LevR
MIRDLVILHFQGERQTLRAYIEQMFATVKFLRYAVSEQEFVDRVAMNIHPSVLHHVAFLNRPSSLNKLYQVVATVEENLAVALERQRL